MSLSKLTTKKGVKTTTTSTLNTPSTSQGNSSLLEKALLDTPGVKAVAPPAKTKATTRTVQFVGSTTNSSGPKLKSIQTTLKGISRKNPYFGDSNQKRGEKIGVHTLATYLTDQHLYTAEDFLHHATQGAHNRGREIYLALATRDWDKKIQQALDIARSFTPDRDYHTRLREYVVPDHFDTIKGDYTYNEYMELFNHHGIDKIKIQKWFATLFGDNGKRNTIYMYGKADAGKTTIIKLFDAFYEHWEIGRCSAQAINSNFWLQDLYMKRLFHADEILATQVNIDTLKLLLEGNDDLTTDIKYAKRVPIKGRPVMMATNEPIWQQMASAADPIKRRCEWIKMVRPWHKKVMFMHTKDKSILKYVLKRLYHWAFPEGYETWKNDTAFIDMIGEIQDLTDVIENHTGPIMDFDDLEAFVSEMN